MPDQAMEVDLSTPDLVAGHRAALDALFPGVIADGVLDATRLGELLDLPVVAGGAGDEAFGLTWAGKRAAVQSLLAPVRATLIPDRARSVDFDTAENVFVEGDNLEVLKLLQKAHCERVKLIYIDPPYNTGNDFVYRDDFGAGSSADNVGRRHSSWLSMMYPRLALARRLLARDGVLAVSIDGNEHAHLRVILDEVFGAANHLNTMVWVSNLKGRQLSAGGAVGTHEYVLVYARDSAAVGQFRGKLGELKALMPAVYKGKSRELRHDAKGPYVTKNELHNTNSRFNERTAPTMVFRIHFHPETGEVRVTDIDDDTSFPGFVTALPHRNSRPGYSWHAWRWSRTKVLTEPDELDFRVAGGRLRIWTKVRDVDGVAIKDLIVGPSTLSGQADLEQLGLARIFETPKPVSLLRVLIAATTSGDDLVLDFFAGSGSSAHAVAAQNEEDGGRRRCISVNLPEPTPPASQAAAAGFATVSDITVARLLRVLDQLPGARDQGLRVYRLGRSNLPAPAECVGDDPRDVDAVAAALLGAEGVAIDAPWEWPVVAGQPVVVAGGVAVVATHDLTPEVVDAALALRPRIAVFLEAGFAGRDALKHDAVRSARRLGITMKTA